MCNVGKVLTEKKISKQAVANFLGIHRNTLDNKLAGETDFTIDEAFAIKSNFLPEYDLEFLFTK